MATIADVARAAGVSITTVSRVLSPTAPPHPVRADTAERVLAAARALKFVPSPLARNLASRRSGLIGLIVPDLADPHYPQIAGGVEHQARAADLSVLICNTLGDVGRLGDYVRLLQARRVDAIVLSGGTSLAADELLTLGEIEVPLVLIGRPTIPVPWPHVSIDNVDGARQATRHLIGLGRRRIVHLGGPSTQTTMADRASGYMQAMREAGLAPDMVESNGTPEDGYARLQQRLDEHRYARLQQRAGEDSSAPPNRRPGDDSEAPPKRQLEDDRHARPQRRLEEGGRAPPKQRLDEGSRARPIRRLDHRRMTPPDAIFAATDRLAIAALALAADRHLHVPDELAIVGFDDIPLAAQLRPGLTTLAQPAHELGTVAIDLAQRLIVDEPAEPITLHVTLVPRASTLGPGGRFVP